MSIVPGQVLVNFDNLERPFQVNYTVVHHGNLSAGGPAHSEIFAYPKFPYPSQKLTPSEEDGYFRTLDASVAIPTNNGISFLPHGVDFFCDRRRR